MPNRSNCEINPPVLCRIQQFNYSRAATGIKCNKFWCFIIENVLLGRIIRWRFLVISWYFVLFLSYLAQFNFKQLLLSLFSLVVISLWTSMLRENEFSFTNWIKQREFVNYDVTGHIYQAIDRKWPRSWCLSIFYLSLSKHLQYFFGILFDYTFNAKNCDVFGKNVNINTIHSTGFGVFHVDRYILIVWSRPLHFLVEKKRIKIIIIGLKRISVIRISPQLIYSFARYIFLSIVLRRISCIFNLFMTMKIRKLSKNIFFYSLPKIIRKKLTKASL